MSTTLWHQLVLVVKRMPSFYAERLHRWVRDAHRPRDLGIGKAVCTTHGWAKPVDWPCHEWLDADERLARAPSRRP